MRLGINFLNSVLGIRLLFVFGVIIPFSVIPSYNIVNRMLNPPTSEAQSTLGELGRIQQAYFNEYGQFEYSSIVPLYGMSSEFSVDNLRYYKVSIIPSMTPEQSLPKQRIIGVIMVAYPQEKFINKRNIPPFMEGVFYDTQSRGFLIQMCQKQKKISNLDEQSLKLFSSQLAIYPYKTGVESNQKELKINDIFPCPEGFEVVQ